jgi:DNA invertase Pin-like site-specific DNA recombinase
MIAVSYLRCSGKGQVDGDTWDRQQSSVSKYAAVNGIEIVSEFRDEGITGKMELENRDGLSACIQYVQEHGIKLVLVESSDRLARDSIVAEVCVREFQRIGVSVVTAEGNDLTKGDDLNPTAKLIRQILAAIAEFDRCVTVNKLRGARKRIKEKQGKCEGRISFGGKPGEAEILDELRMCRRHGCTYEKIAEIMNASNTPTRMGGPWKAAVVAKILKRDITSVSATT